MLPFCNNLRKGDRVLDSASGRPGIVDMNPRETSRSVSVVLQGIKTHRRFDVMNLRLIVDGKAEDHPPVDGMPPEPVNGHKREDPKEEDAVHSLRTDRQKCASEIESMNDRAKVLRSKIDRIDRALLVLTAPETRSMEVPRV